MGKEKIVDILKQINVCALFLLEARNNLRSRVKFANWCLWKRGSETGSSDWAESLSTQECYSTLQSSNEVYLPQKDHYHGR